MFEAAWRRLVTASDWEAIAAQRAATDDASFAELVEAQPLFEAAHHYGASELAAALQPHEVNPYVLVKAPHYSVAHVLADALPPDQVSPTLG